MAALSFYDLGELAATDGAVAALGESGIVRALNRHLACDWSEMDEHDRRANEAALENGGRILSAYRAGDGTAVWVVTEADRSTTTVLLPDEY
jgi:hypothetical protein